MSKNNLGRLGKLILFGALFFTLFYKLDLTALQSYDEAWYGDIARNVLLTKNPFLLQFNHAVYTDHPPFGFWFMSASMFVFGSTEFGVRFSSVSLGCLSLVAIYLLGRETKNERTGLGATLILWSCMWFEIRARSGNLDVPFLFWEILTVYFLVLIKKNPRYLLAAGASFAALFLTKTVVGIGLVPVILYFLWINRRKINGRILIKTVAILFILITPWYIYNQTLNSSFLLHHFLEIGARGQENQYTISALKQSLVYLHICIGKWWTVFGATTLMSFLMWWKFKSTRPILYSIYLWFLSFGLPFFFSSKTEVWHLLPLLPPMAILISFVWQNLGSKPGWLFFAMIIFLAIFQFHQFANLIYPAQTVFSAEKDIAQKGRQYPTIYLMDTFYPTTVFYSQRPVNPFYWQQNAYQLMANELQNQNQNIFLINKNTAEKLEQEQIKFKVLNQNAQYLLIQ